MVEQNIRLDRIALIQHIASICRNKRSGILQLLQADCLRKVLFQQGNCIAAMSTHLDELPGNFLKNQGIIDMQAFAQYMKKSTDTDKGQWDLATESLQVDGAKLHALKSQYALFVLQQITACKEHMVSFEAKDFSNATPVLCTDSDITLHISSRLSQKDVHSLAPHLQNHQTTVCITEHFPAQLADKTLQGLRTIITQDVDLEGIFARSLLDPKLLTQHLLAFTLLDWVCLQDQQTFAQQSFIDNLSQEQQFSRQQIIDHAKQFQRATYYQLFGMQADTSIDFLQSKYDELQSTLLREAHDQLFAPTETNISQNLRNQYQEAFAVLSNKIKRSEYDQYLQSGSKDAFLDQSKAVASEQAIYRFEKLCQQDQPEQAAAFADAHLSKDPSSVSFSIQFVELLLTSNLIHQQDYQKKALQLLKHHIQHSPSRFEPFFLLGKLCLLLQQHDNAMRSFMRALQTRPDLASLRKYIIEKLPDQGPEIALQAIAEKAAELNHYQFLGVHPKASHKEIHQAYRTCCRHFHPDLFFGNHDQPIHAQAKAVFKAIAQAYRVLQRPQQRQAYDNTLSPVSGQAPTSSSNSPPTHFKAKNYYAQALEAIKSNNFEEALVHLRFALQFEPDNRLLQQKVQWAQEMKKAH